MAKYASTDTIYQCDVCNAEVARHHIDTPEGGLKCPNPNCERLNVATFYHYDKCSETPGVEQDIMTYQGGVFIIKYTGLDTVILPSVVVMEEQWYPGECPICAIPYYQVGGPDPIHFVHRIKLWDAGRTFGFKHPYQMHGTNIVENGSQVVLPFIYPSKIWIDGRLIDAARYRNDDAGGWEFYL